MSFPPTPAQQGICLCFGIGARGEGTLHQNEISTPVAETENKSQTEDDSDPIERRAAVLDAAGEATPQMEPRALI